MSPGDSDTRIHSGRKSKAWGNQERVKLLYEWLLNVDFAPKLFLHLSEAASIVSHVLW